MANSIESIAQKWQHMGVTVATNAKYDAKYDATFDATLSNAGVLRTLLCKFEVRTSAQLEVAQEAIKELSKSAATAKQNALQAQKGYMELKYKNAPETRKAEYEVSATIIQSCSRKRAARKLTTTMQKKQNAATVVTRFFKAKAAATATATAAAPEAKEGVCAKAQKMLSKAQTMLSSSNLGQVWNSQEISKMQKFFVEMFPALGADLVNLILSPFVELVNWAASKNYSPYITTTYTSVEREAQRDAAVDAFLDNVFMVGGEFLKDSLGVEQQPPSRAILQTASGAFIDGSLTKDDIVTDLKQACRLFINDDKIDEVVNGLIAASELKSDSLLVTATKVSTSAAVFYVLPCLAAGASIPAVGANLSAVGTGALELGQVVGAKIAGLFA